MVVVFTVSVVNDSRMLVFGWPARPEGSSETAKLLSLAILELRMERYGVTDSELKAVCDAMVPGDAPGESKAGKLLRPYLRVVK